jgi:Fe-Mn family superoxide dismutase
MAFTLPELPYAKDALAPHISVETLNFHHGKHHNAYVTKLNSLVEADAGLKGKTLEELMLTQKGIVFNQAAQVWNHTFYWNSMKPGGGGDPTGAVAAALNQHFGTIDNFRKQFTDVAAGHFGSGWAWLVKKNDGALAVVGTHDAGNPLTEGQKPLLTCDVWEHAYYIDFRNARPEYIKAWWNLVNWKFIEQNL